MEAKSTRKWLEDWLDSKKPCSQVIAKYQKNHPSSWTNPTNFLFTWRSWHNSCWPCCLTSQVIYGYDMRNIYFSAEHRISPTKKCAEPWYCSTTSELHRTPSGWFLLPLPICKISLIYEFGDLHQGFHVVWNNQVTPNQRATLMDIASC